MALARAKRVKIGRPRFELNFAKKSPSGRGYGCNCRCFGIDRHNTARYPIVLRQAANLGGRSPKARPDLPTSGPKHIPIYR
jgi:hypothetical protein